MARTTSATVRAILLPQHAPDHIRDLDPMVATASLLVTAELASDPTMTAELLAEAERWWAAHLWADRVDDKGGLVSQRAFDVAETYRLRSGGKDDLQSTFYGRTLDALTSGRLHGLGKPAARFIALA